MIIKEVGYGVFPSVARPLVDGGAKVVNVAGVGGTRWTAMKAERAATPAQAAIASAFNDWERNTAQAPVRVSWPRYWVGVAPAHIVTQPVVS